MASFDSATFPLPAHMVPTVTLTDEDKASYHALAHEIVGQTVDQERAYRHEHDEHLDLTQWKYVKSKGDLRSYKRIPEKEEKYVMSPMIVVVGTIEGTLENALYGIHNKTTEEIRIMASFTNKSLLDTALLATLESGSARDPYRFMGLKWRVAQTPGGSLIKNRDVTNLEYMGIDVDAHGDKFAFHMLKSVELRDFPAFTNSNVIRSRMMLCCIFRQVSPGVVGCYCKGVFNLGGALLDIIAYNTASDTVLAMAKAAECATIKRLTLLLMRKGVDMRRHLNRDKASSFSSNSSQGRLFSRSSATSIDSLSSLDFGSAHDEACAVCKVSKPSRTLFGGSSFAACTICRRRACSRCMVKHKVLARPKHLKVMCCLACLLEAKTMSVDPRDPYPILNSGDYK